VVALKSGGGDNNDECDDVDLMISLAILGVVMSGDGNDE